jgi:hypothetical protein
VDFEAYPVVTHQSTLKQAFQEMKDACRSALVVTNGSKYAFVEAPEIVLATSEQTAATLEPLMKRTPLDIVPMSKIGGDALDFTQQALQVQLEQYMDDANVRFVLLAVSFSSAIVASRSEEETMKSRASPRDCYCRVDRLPVSPGRTGGNCPHDATHTATVRCV